MANEKNTSTFNEYVEQGSPLESFKSIFETLESAGKALDKIKGFIDIITNPQKLLNDMAGNLTEYLGFEDKFKSLLGKAGLTNKSMDLVNNATGGFISSIDAFTGDIFSSASTFLGGIAQDLLDSVLANIYIPEEVFLPAVKGLAAAKSDPNNQQVLRNACIRHDLVKSIEWLDDYNEVKSYTLDDSRSNDALTAASAGAFKVARYILRNLKKTYIQIKGIPVLNDEDIEQKNIQLFEYENFFNKVIKYIFTYSYDNLSLEDFRNIIAEFPTHTPSSMGDNDDKYSKSAAVSSSEINILAPIKTYKHSNIAEILDQSSDPLTFINPRNKNIKKLYIFLAYSMDYNDFERLIHKELHKRLKYKMISTMENALYSAQDKLIGSPLGKYISDMRESYLSLISKYVKSVEKFLFSPSKQKGYRSEDTVELPSFRPALTEEQKTRYNLLQEALPSPPLFAELHCDWGDFAVYWVDPIYNHTINNEPESVDDLQNTQLNQVSPFDAVLSEIVNIMNNSTKLRYFIPYTIESLKHVEKTDKTEQIFYILHNGILTDLDDIKKNELILNLITKYIIDKIVNEKMSFGIEGLSGDISIESIGYLFPLLNTTGLIASFEKYFEISVASDLSPYQNTEVPVSDIPFYSEILTDEGTIIKIELTGVNEYNQYGEKVKTLLDPTVDAAGIGYANDSLYVIAVDSTGNLNVYKSDPYSSGTLSLEGKVDKSDVSIYQGVGITSIYQINYYTSFYYDGIIFTISDEGIKLYQNNELIRTITVSDGLPTNEILGLSFMPNGNVYIVTNNGIYKIEDYSATSYNTILLGEYNKEKVTVYSNIPGTILTSASIPIETTDDFDIDDMKMINNIISRYQIRKLSYYIYYGTIPK
jgi:hypothetical protein